VRLLDYFRRIRVRTAPPERQFRNPPAELSTVDAMPNQISVGKAAIELSVLNHGLFSLPAGEKAPTLRTYGPPPRRSTSACACYARFYPVLREDGRNQNRLSGLLRGRH
jgi:hypothetical protein